MEAYRNEAIKLMKGFSSVHIEQYPRAENSRADALATLASAVTTENRRTITVEFLPIRSVEAPSEQVNCLETALGGSWMDPVIGYLRNGTLPDDSAEAHRVKAQASQYWISEQNVLYKRSFSGPYMRCVHPMQVEEVLAELHAGTCGSHTGGRSLAHRARSQGYWWPFMQKDAVAYTRKCEKCQKYAPIIRQPATELHPFTSPWPFAQWGLDIMGPFPRGTSSKRFLLVATDYFTKWVEAEALQNIAESNIRGFLWKNIITRFGIPKALVSDNGTQFKNSAVQEFCQSYGITQHYSSVAYPQGNGQAEASNKVILDGLKKRLEAAKGSWVEELPSVLWTYRTTPRRSTGETPFLLTYGTEAVIPLEVGLPTLRTDQVEAGGNDSALADSLDQSQERRETALIRLAEYHRSLIRQRRGLMKSRNFQLGDLVLRKVMGTTVKPSEGKLGQNWEGPYKITSTSSTGAYYLEDMDGNPIANPWNIYNLRTYYH